MELTRREATRAATMEEIKRTALAMMRRHGTTDVMFSEIAREMRMTAPALYRYFASRDDLLTAVITDTYGELADRLSEARSSVPAADPGGRLVALGQCYRGWAREHPERFALLFGLPVPGYAAPEDGPTTEAAKRALGNFMMLYDDAVAAAVEGEPLVGDVTPAIVAEFASPEHGMVHMPPAVAAGMLHAWTMLQGFVSLESFGSFQWLAPQTLDDMFVRQLRIIARAIAVPDPATGWES